ncbi:MAG: hypothetical protein IPP90_06490 [Gemmatimonadaceae bacterium]|nr:hypothetical protein [Gemmatimonadaceae bacterium]
MIKLIYWAFVALDIVGLLFFFVLGLAAAGSSRTSPFLVALYLLLLPGIPLAASMLLFVRASSPVWRGMAFLLAAAPLVIVASMQLFALVQFRANSNAAGDLTFFRAGPMRELVEAIRRNDAAAVTTLASQVDVNRAGMAGMTPLISALRQLQITPDQQDVLRALIKAGADPNKGTDYEVPLEMAMQSAAKSGPEPVRLLLEAGANPNRTDSFGMPIFFTGSGRGSSLAVLTLLLDHGADMKATGPKGETALIFAASIPNWPAAHLLLVRGADWKLGRSFAGLTFKEMVEKYAREKKDGVIFDDHAGADDGLSAVVQFLEQHQGA